MPASSPSTNAWVKASASPHSMSGLRTLLAAVGRQIHRLFAALTAGRVLGGVRCFRRAGGLWGPLATVVLAKNSLLDRVVVQQALQKLAAAVQAAHHRAGRALHDLGDLLVGEVLEISKDHGEPELRGHRGQRALDVAGEHAPEQ